jgi:hypothetical protein
VYLRNCLIENVGPLEFVDLSLPLDGEGNPQPVVLVGQNGSGKTILLSHVADAFVELAKVVHEDVLVGQGGVRGPFFKVVGGTTQRTGEDFGIALLEFLDGKSAFCYVDKSGTLDPGAYREKMGERFGPVATWPVQGNHKKAPISEEDSERIFEQNSICYFPSARHERPHWLNRESVPDEPVFQVEERLRGRLRQPIIVESATQENKQWLLDVMLDSRADYVPRMTQGDSPELGFQVIGNPGNLIRLLVSRHNVQTLLQNVLQEPSAQLLLNYRNVPSHRLSIRTDSGIVPSLDHLSSEQANLFNLFATIIRYADRNNITKSFTLQEISGIVLVDEIDAHAHSDLQYEVLPKLLKLFPKVQFILTSHSPLFLLGMEREYGSDGFQLIEMPNGQSITTERFSEFERSWEIYRRTAAYEKSLQEALRVGSKPLVLTEGKTDPKYIRTALDLLGRQDLLDGLEIEYVGTQGSQGSLTSGASSLKHTRNILEANPGLTNRKVLLLYDCDTNRPNSDVGLLKERTIPRNHANTTAKSGIENLLPSSLFEEGLLQRFIFEREQPRGFIVSNTIREFDKTRFCDYVCDDRKDAEDFQRFSAVIQIFEEFLDAEPTSEDD